MVQSFIFNVTVYAFNMLLTFFTFHWRIFKTCLKNLPCMDIHLTCIAQNEAYSMHTFLTFIFLQYACNVLHISQRIIKGYSKNPLCMDIHLKCITQNEEYSMHIFWCTSSMNFLCTFQRKWCTSVNMHDFMHIISTG